MPPDADDAQVVLARFTHLIEAELAKSVLCGSGIACALQNDHLVGVLPHLSNAVGGVALTVRAGDAEAARRLLDSPPDTDDPRIRALAPSGPLPGALAPDDDGPLQPSPRDQQATRAFRAAVLALLAVPVLLNVYSVYLMLTLDRAAGALSPRGRRHVALAVLFNLAVGWIPLALLLHRR